MVLQISRLHAKGQQQQFEVGPEVQMCEVSEGNFCFGLALHHSQSLHHSQKSQDLVDSDFKWKQMVENELRNISE